MSSGKTFLCMVISLIASNSVPTAVPFPKTDDECRKQLFSVLMRSPAVVMFDNLTSDIVAYDSFCSVLTTPHINDRILGVSKTTTVSTRTLFLSSGNNVVPIQDMTRRCNVINLDPACETPATRNFKNPDLLSDLQQNRAKYVSAALTVIRGWVAAGRPKTECKTIASYGEWSDYCRQTLMWLGLPDPASNMFKLMNEDPERDRLGVVLSVWHGLFGVHQKRCVILLMFILSLLITSLIVTKKKSVLITKIFRP